ncbi:hypothetical protein OG233_25400 [Streptomyces sp. NBC_01218]|uniref:hypothetical protein n=1 Tax=unclassified Streptomyces TaxID=2593676 RepID=UPI0023B9173B|nr:MULTISPECIES: hypothetical protein [unclassified Streptomyces]WEH42592.1 hypothetical protein PZB77_25560 [Streptomyces sp. AM 2-1-1]WSQ54216.1 hypothetical protein OG233_25400 [Streptomyces sp. NBC_01218]
MSGREPGGDPFGHGVQRRVRRSRLLFVTPLVLLGVLSTLLVWETVRANVSAGTGEAWPWRLQLLDGDVLGSLLAVALGAVLARAQYARSTRPHLGSRCVWSKGLLKGDATAWRVGLFNGGLHVATVERCDYRVVLAGEEGAADRSWVSAGEAVRRLTGAGLVLAEDFQFVEFGAGFPLVGGAGYETLLVGAFSLRFVGEVEELSVRFRVGDVVGDSHERVVDCVRNARAGLHAPLD